MGKKKNKQYPRQSRNSNRGESLSFDELRSHFGMEEIIEKKPIQYKIKRKEENELNSHYSYDKNADFINPYNFISLGDGVERKENQKGDLTGYINCELIVKTPLIIPGKIVKEEREHKYYDALVIADKPIIPGNSLRGVIRSQFETLSHSCLSTIDEEMRFTARSQDFFNDAGLLYKDRLVKSKVVYMDFKHFGFSLDEDRCLIKNGKIYKTGEQFYVQLEKNQDVYQGDREYVSYITKNKEENCYEAYLFIGETHPDNYKDKHKYVKLCVVKEHETIICNEVTQLRKDYFTVLQEYRDSKKNIYETHHFYNNLGVDEKSEVIPVWYNQVNDNIYVSPAQRGRYAYKRVIKDLLRVNSESRSYAPCDDENHLCAACSLFGTVQENIAVPSRIRISDAITDENNCIENSYRTLPPLSSPKFSNPEFYLDYLKNRDRKSFNLFNYDFSVFGKEMSPIDSKYLFARCMRWCKMSYRLCLQSQQRDMPYHLRVFRSILHDPPDSPDTNSAHIPAGRCTALHPHPLARFLHAAQRLRGWSPRQKLPHS